MASSASTNESPDAVGQVLQASTFRGQTKQRTVFRTAHFQLAGSYLNRCFVLHFEDGSSERVRLFGSRVNFGDLTGTPDDVQPSFVEHSICIQDQDATSGWFLACRTRQDLEGLADSLCAAGCIMRDLANHCTVARDPGLRSTYTDANGYKLIPARPTSSRTPGTRADVLALKVEILDDNKRALLLNEVQFLLELNHDGIPRAFGLYDMNLKGNRVLAMLTDVPNLPMGGAPLSAWVNVGGLPELVLKDLMAQLCDILVYLHSMLVVHGNVKPQNVICETAADGGVRVVLADFGMAAKAGHAPSTLLHAGSPGYLAPELFQSPIDAPREPLTPGREVNTSKIDVFSFGLTITTMLTGKNPFEGETAAATYRNNAELKYDPTAYLRERKAVSQALVSLLASACAPDPRARCSAAEAASHAWFFGGRSRVTHAYLRDLEQTPPRRSTRTTSGRFQKLTARV
jgi:serine/threonine protein kinase